MIWHELVAFDVPISLLVRYIAILSCVKVNNLRRKPATFKPNSVHVTTTDRQIYERGRLMRVHTRLDKLVAEFPVPLASLGEFVGQRRYRDGGADEAGRCRSQHQRAAQETYEVVLFWSESP